jgi:hypothetical protein
VIVALVTVSFSVALNVTVVADVGVPLMVSVLPLVPPETFKPSDGSPVTIQEYWPLPPEALMYPGP